MDEYNAVYGLSNLESRPSSQRSVNAFNYQVAGIETSVSLGIRQVQNGFVLKMNGTEHVFLDVTQMCHWLKAQFKK